ncbi:MAG: hypothetical protein PF484_03500 [Bacteroidales bacterium]|jgi:hypothetical protein|nr:hypothetical protein [Bacteroidales bacterium]
MRQEKITLDWKGLITEEQGLPCPVVYYPEFSGSFIGFSNNTNSEIYFCSCFKKAVVNFINFRIKYDERKARDPERNYILPKNHFPQKVVKYLIEKDNNAGTDIIDSLIFKDRICHECNNQVPTINYCEKEHGGSFEQNFGWYIHKQFYEFGIKPIDFKILEDVCPNQVFSLLDISKEEFVKKYNHIKSIDMLKIMADYDHIFHVETRKIRNFIEDEVRVKFGAKKIGDAWTNETLLYQLVSEILPNEEIYRHYRPDFLDFLELDIYIPNIKVGIEYQGKQHFEPIEHFGGLKSFEKLIERDKKKKILCEENNIELIYFIHNEKLNTESVEEKLKKIYQKK